MNKTILILLAFSFCLPAIAQDTSSFWPHHLGDMWEYLWVDWEAETLKVNVAFDSTGLNGFHYVKTFERFISTPPHPSGPTYRYYTIDTTNQVFEKSFGWDPSDAWKIYKLDATAGQQWVVYYHEPFGPYEMARVTSTYQDTVFNVPTTVKHILFYASGDSSDTTGLVRYAETLAEGFGLIYKGGGEWFNPLYLRAAKINGTVYGDSTIVSVDESHNTPPAIFHVFQNYPNPFNSTTVINYRLSVSGHVKLTVYDMLGKEIVKLVDQMKPPGSYQVKWDAVETPSGVYFYQLETGSNVKTRKMVLIR